MRAISLLCLLLCLMALPSMAQKTNIGYVYPAGGAQDSTLQIQLGGQGILNAKDILISGEGVEIEIFTPPAQKGQKNKRKGKKNKKKAIITAEDNLQLADKLYAKVKIAPDAPIGLRDIKVVGAKGIVSNRLFFEVSEYPNFTEAEPNGKLEQANAVPQTPIVINGQVEPFGRDFFRFKAQKGQVVVAEVKAQALVPFLADAVPGWFQPVMTMRDAQGKEVGFSDDYKLRPDPLIIFEVPADGEYSLEIHDSIYRGREDFTYRIALGAIPFVRSVFPLGVNAGAEAKLTLCGVNLKSKQLTLAPLEDEGRHQLRAQGVAGTLSNEKTIEITPDDEIVLHEDAPDTREAAILLPEGHVINEKIAKDYDADWYKVELKKGSRLKFDIVARRLGSPLDARLRLYDAQGKLLKQSDDEEDDREGFITHHADPQLMWTCPSEGEYYLRVTDTQNKFGEDYAYRLRYYDVAEDFMLNIEPSAISIPRGGTAHFSVFPVRLNGFKSRIDISSPDLPKGFKLSEGRLAGAKMKMVKMSITAPADAPEGRIEFTLQGSSPSRDGKPLVRTAKPAEAMMQAFFITHLLPTKEFQVDVAQAHPFQIEVLGVEEPVQTFADKKPAKIRVRIKRDKGYDKVIHLALRTNKTFDAPVVKVEPHQDEAEILVTCLNWRRRNQSFVVHILAAVDINKKSKGRNIMAKTMVYSPFFKILTPNAPPVQKPNKRKRDKK